MRENSLICLLATALAGEKSLDEEQCFFSGHTRRGLLPDTELKRSMNYQSLLLFFQKFYLKTCWSLSFLPEEGGFRWAIIKETPQGPVLHSFGSDTSPQKALESVPPTAADALYFSGVFPSLPTLCRQLSLPSLCPKDLSSAVSDTLEQTLSSEATNAYIAHEARPNDQGGLSVTAYIARKEALRSHVELLRANHIDPEWVFPKASCLAAFVSFFNFSGWSYVVDVSKKETSAVVILDGKVVENRALIGGMDLFSCIDSPSSSSDKLLHQLLQHIGETLLAYQERYSLPETTPLTITGGLVNNPQATTTISDFIGSPLSPLHSLEDPSLLSFAPVIGGAFLSSPQPEREAPPNLCTQDLSFSSPLLHLKKPLLFLFGACVTISLLLGWYGNFRAHSITRAMNQDWRKISQRAQEDDSDEEELSSHNLVERAEQLADSLEKKATFPLHPNIPLVSDVLSWLSEQVENVEKNRASEKERLSLQNFHYQLVKRPSKKNPKERYLVRVDLELESSSVALARAFHDTLLAKNDFISSSGGVKWTEAQGKFSTSFFLKDKTLYPREEP